MTAAEATVKEGGVIIVSSESSDGLGGDAFYKTFKEERDEKVILDNFLATPKNETIPDQWQSQIFCRILLRATVIYISEVEDKIIEEMHMIPAKNLDEAMRKAEEIVGKDSTVTVIPDGIAVIVK